jgi:membrane protein implicated in regulation of membrane protease activity
MNQNSETKLVRLRPSATNLFVPILVLAATLFSLMYFSELLAPELYNIVFWVAIIVAALFWLLPLLNWLAASLVVTDQRVINRSGLFGLRRRVLNLSELSSIAVQRQKPLRGKVISLLKIDGQEITVRGYSRTKLLATTIEAEASKTL